MNLNISDAIESNNLEKVKELISKGIKFTKRNSPLGLASSLGNIEIVQILVVAGCSVEWGGHVEPSPLFIASHEGQIEVVKFLIENHAKLNSRNEDGSTPLITSAASGHFEIVKLLVQSGANVNIQSEYGDFALKSAASNGHYEIYEYLLPFTSPGLVKKVDVNSLLTSDGQPKPKATKDALLLIETISEINYIKQFTPSKGIAKEIKQITKLISDDFDFKSVDLNGLNALHHAISSPEIVTILLDKGFRKVINIQDNQGNTPLIQACIENVEKSVRLLLDSKAKTELKNQKSFTALMSTIEYSKSNEIIKLLFESGADLESKDMFGNTAVMIAYSHSLSEEFSEDSHRNLELLKSLGASTSRLSEIDFINHAKNGDNGNVLDFIQNRGNINCIGIGGNSALMAAAANNKLDTVNILLNNGAVVNNLTRSFVTAVHSGHLEVVRALINAGIDVNVPAPILGDFALSRAIEKGNIEMVSILLEAGAKILKNDPIFGDVLKLAKLVNIELYNILSNKKSVDVKR